MIMGYLTSYNIFVKFWRSGKSKKTHGFHRKTHKHMKKKKNKNPRKRNKQLSKVFFERKQLSKVVKYNYRKFTLGVFGQWEVQPKTDMLAIQAL